MKYGYIESELRAVEMSFKKDLFKNFERLLLSYRDLIKVKDLKTASYILLTTVEAVCHDTMFHNGGKQKKAVIDELTALIVNYLFMPS